jgi:glycerate 2-kinase
VISNRVELVENGSDAVFRGLRSDACDIFEAALRAVNPEQAIYNALILEENVLCFEGDSIDLSKINRIYVIGGGKAGGLMAKASETLLGDRITSGVVNVLEGTEKAVSLKHVSLNGSSHPVPSPSGVDGVQRMLELTDDLGDDDLVITLISGGGSALMPLPATGISLNDIQNITGQLLRAGATINELNAVRKHLSAFKGGQLARHCYPARVLSLILSDVISDPLDVIASGPTAPDTSTFADALDILKKYELYEEVPDSIKTRIEDGVEGTLPDTPKKDDPVFNRVSNVLIANNVIAAKAAKQKAMELRYNSTILSTQIEGEARLVGGMLADIAKEVVHHDRPQEKPAAIIIGGETTVIVKGRGKGGRNQELALAASMKISGLSCLVASLGTDGIDGPTDAAGAFVDGDTLNRAEKKGLDPEEYLDKNDSYSFFHAIGDAVITGPTGTNANDLTLILAP